MIGWIFLSQTNLTYADCPSWQHVDRSKVTFGKPDSGCVPNSATEQEKKAACVSAGVWWIPSIWWLDCEKSYSCEELFQTTADARKCNYDRCKAKNPLGGAPNDMNYVCNCKYGIGGGGGTIWIPLNTNFPFIGSCLKKTWGNGDDDAALTVLPTVVSALSKMLIVIILVIGVVMVIIGGIQWAMGKPKEGMEKIKKVGIWFALLGAMSAILALINPNFFK